MGGVSIPRPPQHPTIVVFLGSVECIVLPAWRRRGMGSPLCEREGVSEIVTELLVSARAGRGGVLFVEGEAGLGKSSILESATAGRTAGSAGGAGPGRRHGDVRAIRCARPGAGDARRPDPRDGVTMQRRRAPSSCTDCCGGWRRWTGRVDRARRCALGRLGLARALVADVPTHRFAARCDHRDDASLAGGGSGLGLGPRRLRGGAACAGWLRSATKGRRRCSWNGPDARYRMPPRPRRGS